MRIFFILLLFISVPVSSIAGDISCGPLKVTNLIADWYCPLPEQIGFKLEGNNQWFCTKSSTGTSLVLAAKAKSSVLQVLVNSPDDSCTGVSNYTVVKYVMEI